ANFGSINGKRITQEDYVNAKREVMLRYFLQTGTWWDEQAKQRYDPDVETYKWLLLIQKQEQMNIYVSTDGVADAARDMLAPFERAGMTSPAQFVTQVLQPKG